ncbi:hypothetical protein FRC12_020384 [Ceratobasidium sp. 428]|nr:hypothetical protein FRC12_020384 [Ceratobasidium sp. 428]
MNHAGLEIELGTLGTGQSSSGRRLPASGDDRNDDTTNGPGDVTYGISGYETSTERQLPELAPMDRGFGAWSFVASAFVLETLVWGFGYTYGVFQEYFIRVKTFKNASEATIGSIGTIAIAMYSFIGMLFIIAAQQWRHRIPMMMWSCLGICCVSLLCASFATQAWHLIFLQGICFGIGGGGLYAPVFVYLPEWFSVRKSLACAIIFGGAGAGGMVYPIIINYLLETLGFRWTLRIWTGFVLISSSVALIFMKPRLPLLGPPAVPNVGLWTRIKQQHWSFLYNLLFISISITSFIQSLAYFPVSLYMPVYTSSLGLPPLNGTIVLAVFNLSSVISQMLLGHLCDIAPYPYVIVASGVGASLSAYLLWGFAHNLGLIFAFVIVFGSLSGGFTSVWPTACSDIVGPDHQAIMSNVLGMLSVVKGIAAVIGPVVAASLHNPHDSAVRTVYSGYGFRDVTLFVGSMMAATAAGGVSARYLARR